MPSPVATRAMTYDAEDVQFADLGVFLEVIEGLNESPTVRGVDVVIPSLAGRTARNRKADTLRLVLAGHVMGNGATDALQRIDYRQNVLFVRSLFAPDRDPAELVVVTGTGVSQTINARPDGSPLWNEVVPGLFAYVTIALLSVDPDWAFIGGGSGS